MSFIWPVMLFSVVLIPLVIGLYLALQLRRRRIAAHYGHPGVAGKGPGFLQHIPPLLFLGGLAILLFSLARPEAVVSLPRMQGVVILAFDVSGSMAADDLKPTRMEAAKIAAQEFVERQPRSVQVGIVAFSESGLSVQRPTNDHAELLAAIKRLSPQRGTSLANGIFASLNTIVLAEEGEETNFYTSLTPVPTASPTPMPPGVYTPAVIVLLSDGENTVNPDPLEAARLAAERGVRIYTVGVGSPTGVDLEVEGFIVHTQLDEAMLKEISLLTDGVYYNAANEEDLRAIYDNIEPQLTVRPEKTEITSIFAGLGLLVLLIGGALSLLWFSHLP
jgi:Ca-activated chloride channel homolog